MSDKLIKTLRIKLLSNWTDSCFPCLPLLESFIKFFLQIENILFCSRSGWHRLDPLFQNMYHSCCFYVVYSLGGRIEFRMSSVYVLVMFWGLTFYYGKLVCTLFCFLPAVETSTGFEYLTKLWGWLKFAWDWLVWVAIWNLF